MTAKRVMVLLIGGRLTPNFIGVLGYDPNVIECIVSQDEKQKYQDVLDVLPSFGLSRQPEFLVDAYDFNATLNACEQILARYINAEVIFNVTGGTKVMGIAAYQTAKKHDCKAIYVDTSHARFLNMTQFNEEPVPFTLNITKYLNFFQRSPVRTFDFKTLSISQSQALCIADHLACAGIATAEMMVLLRTNGGGKKGTHALKLKNDLSQEQWELFESLQQFGLISGLQRSSNEIRYTIANNQDWQFINGTWLEVYVYEQAEQLRNEGVFSDCEMSLEIPGLSGARKEMDVACLYLGQMLHCSCKTENKPFNTRHLDELRAVSSLIGGRYCSRLFITNVFAPTDMSSNEGQSYQTFLQQAKDREIVVVTGDQLTNIKAVLRKEAEKPTYWRV